MPELDSKSIEFLRAVDEVGGRATTSEIRNKTGLSNSAVNYRFSKLEELGYLEVDRDTDATPQGVAPVKVAVLTDYADEEIAKGLLVEAKQQASDEPTVEAVAEDLAEVEETVESMQQALNQRILPYARGWERLAAALVVTLDKSEVDVSIQEVVETEVSDETRAFLRQKARSNEEQ